MVSPLVVESTDPGKAEVSLSDAVPVNGQKYETSQRHTLLLVPVGTDTGKSAAATTRETEMISETATPLPASPSTTSQSDKLILKPINTQKP